MLYLSRRKGQSVTITVPASDKPQTVTAHFSHGNRTVCKWGFDAPKDVVILRTEVLEREGGA